MTNTVFIFCHIILVERICVAYYKAKHIFVFHNMAYSVIQPMAVSVSCFVLSGWILLRCIGTSCNAEATVTMKAKLDVAPSSC